MGDLEAVEDNNKNSSLTVFGDKTGSLNLEKRGDNCWINEQIPL